MAFARVLAAWVAVALVLALWRALEHLMRDERGGFGAALRGSAGPLLAEAALVALLGGLWFASLGSGGGWLVFLLVGLLVELSPRFRGAARQEPIAWKPVVGGVIRMMLAGVVCGLVMGG